MRNIILGCIVFIIGIGTVSAQLKDPLGTSSKISPAKSAVKEATKEVQDNSQVAAKATNDSKIAAEIREQLLKNTTLKTTSIAIDVKEGVVTLKGKVETDAQKKLAETISTKVAGVTALKNNLELEKKKK